MTSIRSKRDCKLHEFYVFHYTYSFLLLLAVLFWYRFSVSPTVLEKRLKCRILFMLMQYLQIFSYFVLHFDVIFFPLNLLSSPFEETSVAEWSSLLLITGVSTSSKARSEVCSTPTSIDKDCQASYRRSGVLTG